MNDDLQPLLDLLPAAIPPRYVALALLAVFVWEHLLASTKWVEANSTIRLVGDMAVAVVRRLARRPPPPALLAIVALALGACDVLADTESVAGVAIFAFCVGAGSLLIGSALAGRSARRRRLLDDAADAREIEMTDIDGNRLAVRRGPDLDGRPVMLIRPILPQLSDDEAKAMSDAIAAKRKRGAAPMSLVLALLSVSMALPACSPAETARWRDAGRCAGISAVRQIFGAALTIATSTPSDRDGWAAFGADLGKRYGRDVIGCAAELVAAAPVAEAEEAAGPRPIGFAVASRPSSGPSASATGDRVRSGPEPTGDGTTTTGHVTSTATTGVAPVPRAAHDFAAQLLAQ